MKEWLRSLIVSILWSGALRKVRAEKPYVIAITGSVGKTSTKEAVALVVEKSGRPTFKSPGNMNSDTGIPLALLGFAEPPAEVKGWLKACWRGLFPPIIKHAEQPYYVLEYGSDKVGDIEFITDRLPAQIGIITKVAPVHLAAFTDMEELVEEELAISRGLRRGGWLVLNADDTNQDYIRTHWERVVQFSLSDVTEVSRTLEGITFTWEGSEFQAVVSSKQQLYSILPALAVGKHIGVPVAQMAEAVAAFQLQAGRGRIIEGKDGITIIDESYNASPEAVKMALLTLQEMKGKRRSVAILGRMNELGNYAEQGHREVAEAVAQLAPDRLVLVGEYAVLMQDVAVAAGYPVKSIITFATTEELLAWLDTVVKSKELVLVKGSQNGVRLERVVKQLMAHPEEAHTLLVRQDSYWQTHP